MKMHKINVEFKINKGIISEFKINFVVFFKTGRYFYGEEGIRFA